MKGVFIVNDKRVLSGEGGIPGKIRNQVKVFNLNDIECKIYILEDGINNPDSIIAKIIYMMPFSNILPKWQYTDKFDNIDFIYFRRPSCFTFSTLRFLRQIKKMGIRIILEIPTYPYDKEFDSFMLKVLLIRDKVIRNQLRKYVDLITYLGDEQPSGYIWGIKSIKLFNGIDCSSISVVSPRPHDSINLLCISSCEYWHGYERIIRGLSDYYSLSPEDSVKLHIVGDGPELNKYKEETKRLNLGDKVVFYGKLYGKDLDELYDEMDISIGCLGFHRKKMKVSSELKSRESFAKGLPFAASCDIDMFLAHPTEFFCRLNSGEDSINISEIVAFYNGLLSQFKTRKDLITNIREYADLYFDINKQFVSVVKFLKEGSV